MRLLQPDRKHLLSIKKRFRKSKAERKLPSFLGDGSTPVRSCLMYMRSEFSKLREALKKDGEGMIDYSQASVSIGNIHYKAYEYLACCLHEETVFASYPFVHKIVNSTLRIIDQYASRKSKASNEDPSFWQGWRMKFEDVDALMTFTPKLIPLIHGCATMKKFVDEVECDSLESCVDMAYKTAAKWIEVKDLKNGKQVDAAYKDKVLLDHLFVKGIKCFFADFPTVSLSDEKLNALSEQLFQVTAVAFRLSTFLKIEDTSLLEIVREFSMHSFMYNNMFKCLLAESNDH